jgi:hypothetical protein
VAKVLILRSRHHLSSRYCYNVCFADGVILLSLGIMLIEIVCMIQWLIRQSKCRSIVNSICIEYWDHQLWSMQVSHTRVHISAFSTLALELDYDLIVIVGLFAAP